MDTDKPSNEKADREQIRFTAKLRRLLGSDGSLYREFREASERARKAIAEGQR